MSLVRDTKLRTERARETLASEIFGWAEVVALIGESAGCGWDRVVLKPRVAVDLSQTKAARDLTAKLVGHGFAVRWVRTRIAHDEAEVPVLEICWPLAALSLPQ